MSESQTITIPFETANAREQFEAWKTALGAENVVYEYDAADGQHLIALTDSARAEYGPGSEHRIGSHWAATPDASLKQLAASIARMCTAGDRALRVGNTSYFVRGGNGGFTFTPMGR